jgi:hypothetical protein
VPCRSSDSVLAGFSGVLPMMAIAGGVRASNRPLRPAGRCPSYGGRDARLPMSNTRSIRVEEVAR